MPRIVGEVMTSEVVEAHRETSLKDVARLLYRHRISGLPVVDHDGKVLGVISETDLIRFQVARSADEPRRRLRPSSLRRGGPRATTTGRSPIAGDMMSTPAVTVHPQQRVADAARVMERRHVDRLPVVDEEDRLIGIATRRDLLRVFVRTDEEIRREVMDDVLGRAGCPSPGTVIVSVRDGMVTLEGQTERSSDIGLTIGLTWRVDGVIGVVNKLTYRSDDTPPAERVPSRTKPTAGPGDA